MIDFRHAPTPVAEVAADVLVVGVTTEDEELVAGAAAAALTEGLGRSVVAACHAVDMDGSVGSTAIVPAGDGLAATLVVAAGLGPGDEVDADAVRAASAAAAGIAARKQVLATTLHTTAGIAAAVAARAVVEGTTLAHHALRDWKTDDDPRRLADVLLVGGDADEAATGIRRGTTSAGATTLVRDLGNTPPADKRPPAFASRVEELLADLPVEVETWDQARLEEEGFGGHLAVGAGSEVEPRFVQLRYRPDGASRHVALLGKGITFDSGGLSLKSPKAMEWMKIDMAGAATVVGAVRAAAAAELPVAVTGLLCLAENMPSGSATRPGDVITMNGGTTVEVLNTDAEGRLVMADGLFHAGTLGDLDALVDMATLTGACIQAVGPRYTAVLASDDDLADALLAAADEAAEPMWRLPLAEREYGEEVKSDIADVRNVGGTGAGTIRAALFLQTFVPDGIPWAHLDIAGTAWNDNSPYGQYVPKGATGIPARTVVDWLWGLGEQ